MPLALDADEVLAHRVGGVDRFLMVQNGSSLLPRGLAEQLALLFTYSTSLDGAQLPSALQMPLRQSDDRWQGPQALLAVHTGFADRSSRCCCCSRRSVRRDHRSGWRGCGCDRPCHRCPADRRGTRGLRHRRSVRRRLCS